MKPLSIRAVIRKQHKSPRSHTPEIRFKKCSRNGGRSCTAILPEDHAFEEPDGMDDSWTCRTMGERRAGL